MHEFLQHAVEALLVAIPACMALGAVIFWFVAVMLRRQPLSTCRDRDRGRR